MSKTQEDVIRSWYEQDKHNTISSMYADQHGVQVSYGTSIARRIHDGFVIVNTDVLRITYRGSRIFNIAMRVIGDRAIPISFTALHDTTIPQNELRVIYRATWKNYRNIPKVILGVNGTKRSLIQLHDNAWVGFVETKGFYRDPLEAIYSLIPEKAKEAAAGKDIGVDPNTSQDVFRHGEYYLIPRKLTLPKGTEIEKWKGLDRETNRGHKVRDMIKLNGVMYIRGTIRHHTRRMVSCRFYEEVKDGKTKLVESWYEVAKSIQVGSWKGSYYWG